MRDNILIINEEGIVQKYKNEHEPYAYSKREITCRKDFEQCYVAVYEIPPKKSNYPFIISNNPELSRIERIRDNGEIQNKEINVNPSISFFDDLDNNKAEYNFYNESGDIIETYF